MTDIPAPLSTTICDLARSSPWVVLTATLEEMLESGPRLSLSLARDLGAFGPRCPRDAVALRCPIVAGRKEKAVHRQRDGGGAEGAGWSLPRDPVVLDLLGRR